MRQILLLIAVSSIAVTSGCKKEPEPSAAPSSSSNVEATSSVSTAAANVGIENQIVGTWVPAGLGSASCQRGDYIKFNKNGSYETGADLGADNGSWQYADGELSFENNPPETVNLLNNDTLILGGSGTWTRCEASEQQSSTENKFEDINSTPDEEEKNISSTEKKIVQEWYELNEICRGGSGDERKTLRACDMRDQLYRKMRSMNLCYGKNGQYGYQYRWHHCAPTSLR